MSTRHRTPTGDDRRTDRPGRRRRRRRRPLRPDGTLKVTGEFAYASDLWHDEMLLGRDAAQPAPARPHPSHRHHRGADRARRAGRCSPPTTCPGENAFGLEHADQPVLAVGVVRYQGEPVALVAADHPETARRAAAADRVDYEVLPAVTDARAGADGPHDAARPVAPARATSCGT